MQIILVYGDLIHSLVTSYMIPYLHIYIRTYMHNRYILTCINMYVYTYMHASVHSAAVLPCAVTKGNPKKRAIPVYIML